MHTVMDQIARTPKQIGEALRRRREQTGCTQAELGKLAGLRQATISQIENGNKATRIESISLVLAALNVEFVLRSRSQAGTDDFESLL